MNSKQDIELECLKEGVLNEFTLRRITTKLIKEYQLPDGRYDLKWSSVSCIGLKYVLNIELVLPKSRPIRYGTSVIGNTTHICLVIVSDSSNPLMDVIVGNFQTVERAGEVYHHFILSLHEGRAGERIASSL